MNGVNPRKALSLMRPNSLPHSRPQTRFDYGKLLVLTLCILLFAGTVRGQSLVVVSGGNTVSQGGTASRKHCGRLTLPEHDISQKRQRHWAIWRLDTRI
jgi:hypothetical protein